MKNNELVNDCLYYIGMTDALVDDGGIKEKKGGVTVITNTMDVTDSIKIAYELGDYAHPGADPFGGGPIVYFLKIALLYNGEILRKECIIKKIGSGDKNYLEHPASREEKFRYILKPRLLGEKYFAYSEDQKKRKPVPPEVLKILMQHTKNLIANRKKDTREKK